MFTITENRTKAEREEECWYNTQLQSARTNKVIMLLRMNYYESILENMNLNY